MTLGLHLGEDLFDCTISADQKSSALYAQYFIAVHVLLFQHAVGFGGFLIHIAEKSEWEPVLFFEARLCSRGIR